MKLQEYKGYFVDYRLKQFRSNVPYPQEIEFVDFDSDKGDKLLAQMIRKGLADWSQLHL
jgi:hypothetical protein